MTAAEILAELEQLGNEQSRKILRKHGATEPLSGVKIEDLKKIQKRVKTNYQLALDLWNSRNSDAMYLASLISDPGKMTKTDLEHWAATASWHMLSECAVAWTAAESPLGWDLALKWIESDQERIATAGWATLSSIFSIKPNPELDLEKIRALLQRVATTLHQAPNRVRYVMNGFVIAAGSFIPELTGEAIGKVKVDMNGTACKVPFSPEYIRKVADHNALGKKRKTAKC